MRIVFYTTRNDLLTVFDRHKQTTFLENTKLLKFGPKTLQSGAFESPDSFYYILQLSDHTILVPQELLRVVVKGAERKILSSSWPVPWQSHVTCLTSFLQVTNFMAMKKTYPWKNLKIWLRLQSIR